MMRDDAVKGDARVAELVDALDLGSSGATRESSSLSFRTIRNDLKTMPEATPEKSRVVTAKVTVSVAQLVEPRIVIPVVVGSSPIVHPSFLRRFFVRAVSSVGRAADS